MDEGEPRLGGRAEQVVQDECRSLDEHEVGKRDSVTLQVRKLCIPVWRAQGAPEFVRPVGGMHPPVVSSTVGSLGLLSFLPKVDTGHGVGLM